MSNIICITNRRLCSENFADRVEMIAHGRPKAIILREKDLSPEQYRILAREIMEICRRYDVACVLHTFADIAAELGADMLHLPLWRLRELTDAQKRNFSVLGASCHSAEEACEAQALGASYITAGHVFATDCKKGLPPRGLGFLREVCKSVSIPVYAIGGISSDNIASVRSAGAAGACIMSGLMKCSDPSSFLEELS